MNLCITNVCNRRCEYCFQKEWFLANSSDEIKEMSLEDIAKILDWYDKSHFKILGGEPLLYSRLEELLKLIKDKNKTIILISNISINPEKFKKIVETYGGSKPIEGWLINTDYPPHQENIFLENYKTLLNAGNMIINLSTTLLPDKSKIKEASNRLRELVKISGKKPLQIRISPSEPNHMDNFNTYNFTLDAIDIYLRLKRVKKNIQVHFDCPLNSCEIDYETLRDRGMDIGFSMRRCYDNMPFDIMPDRSAIWCSSSRFLNIPDVLSYSSIEECRDELKRQYDEYWRSNNLLCDYKFCGKYGICEGLCPAKNESLKLLLNKNI